jgi:hypothetical protein
MAENEISEALPYIAKTLSEEVRRRRWQGLGTRLRGMTLWNAAGHLSLGDLMRLRAPREAWEAPTAVDQLYELVAAVEHSQGAAAAWAALREWCEYHRPWPIRGTKKPGERFKLDLKPPRQPKKWTVYWLVASEASRWVRLRHVGFDGQLDGETSTVEVIRIMKALGWPMNFTRANFKQALAEWEKTHPAFNTITVPTRRLGKLLLVDAPPAGRRRTAPPSRRTTPRLPADRQCRRRIRRRHDENERAAKPLAAPPRRARPQAARRRRGHRPPRGEDQPARKR